MATHSTSFQANLRSKPHERREFTPWQIKYREKCARRLQKNLRTWMWNKRFRAWYQVVTRLKSRVSLRSKKAKLRSQLMYLECINRNYTNDSLTPAAAAESALAGALVYCIAIPDSISLVSVSSLNR